MDDEFEASVVIIKSPIKSQVPKINRKQYRPKVQAEWKDEEVITLIKCVEERRSLWDKSLAEYKLPKALTWQEIAEIIGPFSVEECKAKWTNLRVTFNVNLAKLRTKKSGQGTDENKKIVWKFFNSMIFLEAADVHQATESTSSMSFVSIYQCTEINVV